MRQRQDEVLGKSIMQAEQDVAVVMFAVDRILADVVQGVMHPPHVPFVAEAETAKFDRPRYLRPCGGLFRGRGGMGKSGIYFRIESPEEINRFEVFPSAIPVRDPGIRRSAIIEIKH